MCGAKHYKVNKQRVYKLYEKVLMYIIDNTSC